MNLNFTYKDNKQKYAVLYHGLNLLYSNVMSSLGEIIYCCYLNMSF